MKKRNQEFLNKSINARLVLAFLFCTLLVAAESFAFELPRDTIIIDGITVNIKVTEGESSDSMDEEPDTLDLPVKLRKSKEIYFQYNRGFVRSQLDSPGDWTLSEFTGAEPLTGNFSGVHLAVQNSSNSGLLTSLGVSYNQWSEEWPSFSTEELSDSLFSFYSAQDEKLFQVTRNRTIFGEEYDTLEMDVIRNEVRRQYVGIDLGVGFKLLKEKLKKKKSAVWAVFNLTPGLLIKKGKYNPPRMSFEEVQEIESEEPELNSFLLSGTAALRYAYKFSEKSGVNLELGFRQNLTNVFSDSNLLIMRGSSPYVGIGFSFLISPSQ